MSPSPLLLYCSQRPSSGPSLAETILAGANKTSPRSLDSLDPTEPYDIIFIDADKSGYPRYLEKILSRSQPGQARRILKPGGLIVADNVLRRGLVADSSEANPWSKGERERPPKPQYIYDVSQLKRYPC